MPVFYLGGVCLVFFLDRISHGMSRQANRWEAAHKLASSYMSEGEVRVLYMEQAQKMEAGGSLLEAEKLYLQVGEVRGGAAINMHHTWHYVMRREVAPYPLHIRIYTNNAGGPERDLEGACELPPEQLHCEKSCHLRGTRCHRFF